MNGFLNQHEEIHLYNDKHSLAKISENEDASVVFCDSDSNRSSSSSSSSSRNESMRAGDVVRMHGTFSLLATALSSTISLSPPPPTPSSSSPSPSL